MQKAPNKNSIFTCYINLFYNFYIVNIHDCLSNQIGHRSEKSLTSLFRKHEREIDLTLEKQRACLTPFILLDLGNRTSNSGRSIFRRQSIRQDRHHEKEKHRPKDLVVHRIPKLCRSSGLSRRRIHKRG